MSDDFFDDYDDNVGVGGDIGAFLKHSQGVIKTDPARHPSLVDKDEHTPTKDNKDVTNDKDSSASYSESFESENKDSESTEKNTTESKPSNGTAEKTPEDQTKHSEGSETSPISQVTSASLEGEATTENNSDSNNKVSAEYKPKKTEHNVGENDKKQSTLSQTESKPQWTGIGTQGLSESETSDDLAQEENEEALRLAKREAERKEKKKKVIREWIERKTRESRDQRKEEARKTDELAKQEQEELERKKRQEEKKKKRIKEEVKEWHSRKDREEKEEMQR